MRYKIVIARYNESLNWTDHLKRENLVIYNKGNPLDPVKFPVVEKRQNIGREVESYMHYVINNYDNLPDYVIFLQGYPFDHMNPIVPEEFQEKIDNLIDSKPKDILCFMQQPYVERHYRWPSIKTVEYCKLFFTPNFLEGTIFSAGCQYLIPKQNILSRPIQFYMRIQGMLLNQKQLTIDIASEGHYEYEPHSMNGWCLERLLGYVFSIQVPLQEEMKQKKYLVTGGAGFIGSNLVNMLSKNNTVVVVDNLTTGDITNIVKNDNIHFINGSVLDSELLDRVGYVDGIFHLAAMSKVLPSLENKDMFNFCMEQNILGTINVLKFASSYRKPMKVIYSASSTAYGLNPIPNVETQQPDCQTPYALSKYCGELCCELFYKMYKLPSVRLKYFMVYGPNEPSTGSYAIVTGIFLKRKRENLPLLIHGDGSQTRDFVHVEDICQANILAMENEDLVNETINVGTGEMISIKELADLISADQIHVEGRKIDLKHTLCDTTKLKEKLGFIPSKKIKDYILSLV
jgi:nucleoside-diphosphate-sugar epimerase